jgi:hypothetical protein
MAGLEPAAGAAAAAQGTLPPLPAPGGIPQYFGPSPNYANSPMPRGSIAAINSSAPAADTPTRPS